MTTTSRPADRPLSLEDLSLRANERGLVIGGTGAGKSYLADWLGAEFCARYWRRGGRRLILDSKPRYRAQFTARGLSAAKRYKSWGHGQPIPGSVVVDTPQDLEMAWKSGARTVIAQGDGEADIPRLVMTARAFLDSSKASRPQLLQVDETMDFFHSNGGTRGGNDALVRASRAGRERGTAALYCSQRTRGIPATLMEELERLYCFRIDYKGDSKRFQEMGAPDFVIPTRKREFMYWYKEDYGTVHGPYILTPPKES